MSTLPEKVIRVLAPFGTLASLLRNRDKVAAGSAGKLAENDITVVTGRGICRQWTLVAGLPIDHGEVVDEAAMLALHVDSAETPTPRWVVPGDSCIRADDPGWRWHCIAGNGTTLAEWERRPLAGALSGLAVSGHTHAISAVTGLQTALDGKQAALTNATVVAALSDSGGSLAYNGTVIGGGANSALDSLIAALSPVAWYSADKGALDSAGAACADGLAVATWQDQSGHGYHLTQSTAGARPTLETGERNGLPVVRFDGVDDYLLASTFPSIDLTRVTVLLVFQQRTESEERGVYVIGASGSGGGWGATQRIYGATASTSLSWGVVASETVATLSGSGPTPWGVWTHRVLSGAVTGGRDGITTATVTGASMSSSLTGLLLGGYWDSGVALPTGDLDVAEMVVIPQGMPDATLAVLASLLRAKWGI